jgi:pSer/pThr/pTyr-binding forkhead associated (FHA) protein
VKLIVLKNNILLSESSLDTSDSFENYEFYIGRSEDCHVRIDDPLISRHHFIIKKDNDTWNIEKITTLGTIQINGSNIIKHRIQLNEEIKFGTYSLFITDIDQPSTKGHSSSDNKIETRSHPEKIEVKDLHKVQETADEIPIQMAEVDKGNFLEDPTDKKSTVHQNFDNSFSSGEIQTISFESNENEIPENDALVYLPSTLDDNDLDEETRFFQTFINYELQISGEFSPYDRFQLDRDEIYIGRDIEKCQIILNDPDVSLLHAILRKNYNEVFIEDLNSSNGTLLNGERINKSRISTGDEFLIGTTSFTLKVRSDLLENEAHRLMPVESGQVIETEEFSEEEVTENNSINLDSEFQEEKNILKRYWKDPAKRPKLLIVLVAMGLLLLFLPEDETVVDPKVKIDQTSVQNPKVNSSNSLKLSKELENARNVAYELGVSYFDQGRYDLAQTEFQKVVLIDPEYKKVQSYFEQTKIGLKRIAELEDQKRAEEQRIKMKKVIDDLLVKARDAVNKREVSVAEGFFSQIVEKDPENFELSQLKIELEAWQKEQEKKALELAIKEAERKRMLDALNPGKTYFLKKEWHSAIFKLESFLKLKGIDEDLIKEASSMMTDAKNQMENEINPILLKARTLKEDQDLKAAYEAFLGVLKIDPTHKESLNEADDIKNQLDIRSKKIYREGIIAESLSLFSDAKEKFQEVQQVSPTDSEYYKKASEKLKNYLE